MYGKGPTVNESNANLLNTFDFSEIDSLDPSLSEGFRVIYEKDIPFHIRFEDSDPERPDNELIENIHIKMLILGDIQNPQVFKLELSSDNDLFFFYAHTVSNSSFRDVKEQQRLHVDFKEYPNVCIKSFSKCENSEQFIPLFILRTDGSGLLNIVQLSEYRNMDVISFECQAAPEEVVRQQITYKYGSLKSKISLMEGRLQDINELVRLKNPSLLLQIQKSPAKTKQQTLSTSFKK
mmetsp:Transcript_56635/g.64916  ORF Transcript_56635/g.64916 Transcript_56635/m.64916 type:complete len:236 (+) Transcript_56635:40-747(+)